MLLKELYITPPFKSGDTYYHPQKNTISDVIVCLFAVLIPELLIFYAVVTLPGVKHFRFSVKLLFPFVILAILLFALFIWGKHNLAGGGASLGAGIYYLLIRIVPLIYLIEGAESKRHRRTKLFIQIAMIYFILSFLFDALFLHNYANRRQLLLLGHLEIGNSTNYINMLVLGLSSLLIIKSRWFYLCCLVILFISVLWDNRTGLLCCTVLLAIKLFSQSKLLALLLSILAAIYLVPLITQTRLGAQGIDSLRWVSQLDAFENLIAGKFIFGGYKNYLGDTEWLHNIYLDVYRVAGVIPLCLAVIFTIYPFFFMQKSRLVYRIVCAILAILIGMSSVVFEGSHIEYLFFFIVLYNSLFIVTPLTKPVLENKQV